MKLPFFKRPQGGKCTPPVLLLPTSLYEESTLEIFLRLVGLIVDLYMSSHPPTQRICISMPSAPPSPPVDQDVAMLRRQADEGFALFMLKLSSLSPPTDSNSTYLYEKRPGDEGNTQATGIAINPQVRELEKKLRDVLNPTKCEVANLDEEGVVICFTYNTSDETLADYATILSERYGITPEKITPKSAWGFHTCEFPAQLSLALNLTELRDKLGCGQELVIYPKECEQQLVKCPDESEQQLVKYSPH